MIATAKQIANKEVDQIEIVLKKGLLGFENMINFLIKGELENGAFYSMEALKHPNVSFVLINPFVFFSDYEFELNDHDVQELDIKCLEDVLIFTTITIPEKAADTTTNLLAPIVINRKTFQGKQVILDDRRYTTKHKIFNN